MLAFSTSMLSELGLPRFKEELNKRGVNVYTMSEVVGVTGRDRKGNVLYGTVEVPLFGLSVYDRVAIAQRCDAVFGVVSGRASRISALEWSVVRESKEEDRLEAKMKMLKQVFDEYAGQSAKEIIARGMVVRTLHAKLPDLLPDLSNFDGALLRWRKRIQMRNEDESTRIEDWFHEPNSEDDWEDFLKKWVVDLMVHGADAIYKEEVEGKLENLYHLPGGSVVPIRERFVGPLRMYVQAMPGMDSKMYFGDEITWSTYMPNSGIGYGLIPLEALVNKVAETLFFDQRAAEMADGTVPPEKVAVFGENSPFGDLTGEESLEVPIDEAEQSRLEILLNEPRKGAIRVLSGRGTPAILDLTRSDTFSYQSDRQRFVRESVGFVYCVSNVEMNLTGSDDTSGRSTSESQERIEKEKGIYPLVKTIENKVNREFLPLRWGSGYLFEFKSGLTDEQQATLDKLMMDTGTYAPNEIRVKRGDQPWGPEFDKPPTSPGTPDGSQTNPISFRDVG